MVIVNCKHQIIKQLNCWCPHCFTARSSEQVQLRLLQHLCTSFLYQIKYIKQARDTVTNIVQSGSLQLHRQFLRKKVKSWVKTRRKVYEYGWKREETAEVWRARSWMLPCAKLPWCCRQTQKCFGSGLNRPQGESWMHRLVKSWLIQWKCDTVLWLWRERTWWVLLKNTTASPS